MARCDQILDNAWIDSMVGSANMQGVLPEPFEGYRPRVPAQRIHEVSAERGAATPPTSGTPLPSASKAKPS
jgi:hypothetical protein